MGFATSMAYQLTGSIKKIFDTQTFPSGFSKREFVVSAQDGSFVQDIKFDCLKEKAEILGDVSEGDEVTVHFDIGGREYNGRYFVNLNAWRLEKGNAGGGGGAATKDEPPLPEDTTDYGKDEEEIPF